MALERPDPLTPVVQSVLVVDDEKHVVTALKRELRTLKCRVTGTTSGRRAMNVLREQTITLLITDHKMAGVNGIDLVRYSQQYSPHTKIIMLSGACDLQAAVELLNRGMIQKYMTKPWSRQALSAEVIKVLSESSDPDTTATAAQLSEQVNEQVMPDIQDFESLILIKLMNFNDISLAYGEDMANATWALLRNRVETLMTQPHQLYVPQPGVYALYLKETTSEITRLLCGQMKQHLQRTLSVEGQPVFCHIGIGFRYLQECQLAHKTLINSLLDTIVRDSHRISISHLDNSMLTQYRRQQQLSAEVQHGLSNNEFKLAFQPKVDMQTGLIDSAEVLLRWQHHSLGWVPPLEFVRLAELDGQIEAIGEWVLDRGLKVASELRRFSSELTSIAINISAKQLQSSRIVEFIGERLKHYYLAPEFIELEITETALAENTHYLEELLWQLKLLGVRLAIDDFGAGFTSFSYLSKLPIDTLKLDKCLITNLHNDNARQAFISNLIMSCKKIGIQVVAEGVEEQAELNCLRTMQCDKVQGYIYSPAVPRPEFEKLVIRQPYFQKLPKPAENRSAEHDTKMQSPE